MRKRRRSVVLVPNNNTVNHTECQSNGSLSMSVRLLSSVSLSAVPPDILDSSSTDMVVREGSNVTLKCAARGSPTPVITWRREGNEPITLPNGEEGNGVLINLITPCQTSANRQL